MPAKTTIVATLGPASNSEEGIESLIGAGVDVFRLNLSHGAVADHLIVFHRIRAIADRLGVQIGILCDLPGPKVRAASFPDGGVRLTEGDVVELAAGKTGSRQVASK